LPSLAAGAGDRSVPGRGPARRPATGHDGASARQALLEAAQEGRRRGARGEIAGAQNTSPIRVVVGPGLAARGVHRRPLHGLRERIASQLPVGQRRNQFLGFHLFHTSPCAIAHQRLPD
jgi:hypothetical protein